MPKARRRRKGIGGGTTAQSRTRQVRQEEAGMQRTHAEVKANQTSLNRPFLSPTVRGPQSLIFPGRVMLGCWLMAFTLFFLDTEPNHALFGGMAILMALLWTFSFGVRVRKLLLLKS